MIFIVFLFLFMCFGIGFILNIIVIFYGFLVVILFGIMVVVFVIWVFIFFFLVFFGIVVGRNWSGVLNNFCRVKIIFRFIFEKKWYFIFFVVFLMGGLLFFGSIFIEMYFVFIFFWNYKVNYSIIMICFCDKVFFLFIGLVIKVICML